MQRSTTILGMGAYIPEEVRTNQWWPEALVRDWGRKERGNVINLQESRQDEPSSLHPALIEELEKIKGDPFGGTKERRVAPPEMLPSQMELAACREAIADSGVDPDRIGMIMAFSLPPDSLFTPNVFKLHHELGLKNARAVGINVICHSFMTSMDLLHHQIANGAFDYALIVTSTKYSAVMDYTSSISVAAGDGAVAAVLGPCPKGKGILVSKHHSDTRFHDSMHVLRRPPSRPTLPAFSWGETQTIERPYFTVTDAKMGRGIVAAIPVIGEQLKREILDEQGISPDQISLLATNAAFSWYSPVLSKVFGIPMERVEDNVASFSNMGTVNLPMNLYLARKKQRLKDGELVLLIGHGGGLSYGGILMRWHQ
jgi:3-oxoacyl-[acyl-carrier-protein] synthase-3